MKTLTIIPSPVGKSFTAPVSPVVDGETVEADGVSHPQVDQSGSVDAAKSQPLTQVEKTRLAIHESTIRSSLAEFVAVGQALKAILDGNLYRENHSSFAAYCQARFDFGRAYGYRLIKAAEVIEELKAQSPAGDTPLPTSEGQARELAKVKPAERLAVLQLAVQKAGDKPLNSVVIRSAAHEIAPREPKPNPRPQRRDKTVNLSIDLEVFQTWLSQLQRLAQQGEVAQLIRLLERARAQKTITTEAIIPTTSNPRASL